METNELPFSSIGTLITIDMAWLGLAIGLPKQSTPINPTTPFYNNYWPGIGSIAALFYLFWFGYGLIR